MSAPRGNANAVRHGHKRNGHASRTYQSWRAMIDRCTREYHPYYPCYGGRGIQIDPSWLGRGGFVVFLAHVGVRPTDTTLDRIDVNGHYMPGNVRWATASEQRLNRRDFAYRQPDAPDDYYVAPLFHAPVTSAPTVEIPF